MCKWIRSPARPQLRIVLNRDIIGRYGINIDDVQSVLRTAIGGEKAGQVFEGIKRFDILVRYDKASRATPEAIRALVIRTGSGSLIPLDEIAKIDEIVGPRQITRENNQRFITVQANVRGRDIGSFVADGQKNIGRKAQTSPWISRALGRAI